MIAKSRSASRFGERAGRLVEDDHPGTRDQGPGDLDQLLSTDAQVADLGLGPDVGMLEQGEGLGRPSAGARGGGCSPARTRSWPSMMLASTVRCGARASSW